MATKDLTIVIKAKNEAQTAFSKLESGLSSLGSKVFNIQNAITTGFVGVGIKSAIDSSNQLNSALIGLNSVAEAFGQNAEQAKQVAISLSEDGLMSVRDSAAGLKNLLASGFGLEQATNLMLGFKDSAAFGKQGSLEFGQAIVGATEGIKNQNSILVDNAGITKNLSVILSDAGYSAQDLGKVTTDVGIRTALYNGILKEAAIFQGDAAKLSETLGGKQAELSTKIFNTKAAIGEGLAPVVSRFIEEINKWIDKMGGPAGITKKTTELIDKTTALVNALQPLVVVVGGSAGVAWAFTKAVSLAKGFTAALQFLALQSAATQASMSGLRLAILGLPLGITIAVALAGFTLVMNQIRSLKKEIGEQVASEGGLYEMRQKYIKEYSEMMKSEDSSVRKLGKAKLDLLAKTIQNQDNGTKIELSGYRARVQAAQAEINQKEKVNKLIDNLKNKLTETQTASGSLTFPPSFSGGAAAATDSAKKLKEETDELKKSYEGFSDSIDSFAESSNEALASVKEKIAGLQKEMQSLVVGNVKNNLGVNSDLANEYVKQEQKVADLQAQFNKETDAEKKSSLLSQLEFEKAELQKFSTIAIAYENDVNEARRRNGLSDIARAVEDLNQKRTIMNMEFEEKFKQINAELALEEAKRDKIVELQKYANQMTEKYLAQQELITTDSLNREIAKYNELAKAISAAKSGKTSSYLSYNKDTQAKAGQNVAPVNITITGNTLLDSRSAEKIGDMLVKKLSLNGGV